MCATDEAGVSRQRGMFGVEEMHVLWVILGALKWVLAIRCISEKMERRQTYRAQGKKVRRIDRIPSMSASQWQLSS